MNKYDEAYGLAFSELDLREVDEAISNFTPRFGGERAAKLFAGKACLDAGCGAGRGTLYMLRNGAKHVTSVDISSKNTVSTRRNLKKYSVDCVDIKCASITELPFPDESFDLVWSYGVVHHTDEPEKALHELSRVLKQGGGLVVFLYGKGALNWFFAQKIRKYFSKISEDFCIEMLKEIGATGHQVSYFLDDIFAPYIFTYDREAVSKALKNMGFNKINFIETGCIWDTNVRKRQLGFDQDLMGEGDIRIVANKEYKTSQDIPQLDGFDIASEQSTSIYSPRLQGLEGEIDKKFSECISDEEIVKIGFFMLRNVYAALQVEREIDLSNILDISS